MINDIEVKLTAQEVQAIITALKNVSYEKCNFKGKEKLIEKLKEKSNTIHRNKKITITSTIDKTYDSKDLKGWF